MSTATKQTTETTLVPTTKPTINIFCQEKMKEEANRLEANGTLQKHVEAHIAQFGKSASNAYNVKVSTSGMITVAGVDPVIAALRRLHPSYVAELSYAFAEAVESFRQLNCLLNEEGCGNDYSDLDVDSDAVGDPATVEFIASINPEELRDLQTMHYQLDGDLWINDAVSQVHAENNRKAAAARRAAKKAKAGA